MKALPDEPESVLLERDFDRHSGYLRVSSKAENGVGVLRVESRRSWGNGMVTSEVRYSADITAGSLKLAESRAIAGLLLKGATDDEFRHAVVEENLLQARNPRTSIRIARLVRQRLSLMTADLWRLIRDGSGDEATHAVLAAAVKHSPLLGDFLDLVVREQWRTFNPTLPKRLWDEYLQGCRERDPEMPQWNESTRRKTGTVVYHVLQQAGYIENTRGLKLLAVHVAEPVVRCLKENSEEYVLRCLQVTR